MCFLSPVVRFSHTLRTYFRSGWVFLIPYLIAYLIYAWLKLPLNPIARAAGPSHYIGENGSAVNGQWTTVPSLLHVYWALHAIHLALGALALCAWWRSKRPRAKIDGQVATPESLTLSGTTHRKMPGLPLPLPSPISRAAYDALPWFFLALFFCISGPYLEWPSDPWEHWGRINRWKELTTVGSEAIWFYKTEHYFFAYSLLGSLPLGAQIQALSVFHAGMSLLLCWQLYRLARLCGASRQTSMLFIVAQALLLGNNIFGFYRYYGLSSTIPAMIGAFAAIRCFLTFIIAMRLGIRRHLLLKSTLLGSLILAVIFGAHQHVQSLGIAGIGMAAVLGWTIWRRWNRLAQIAAALVFLMANLAAVVLWPRHPYLDTVFRHGGWLNSWYGFQLFTMDAGATRKALEILGIGGLINLAAGMILLRRNHVVGWLTLCPLFVLEMPILTIPLSNALAAVSPSSIAVFHRAFLAIPAGLALAVVGSQIFRLSSAKSPSSTRLLWTLPTAAILALCVITSGFPSFNRMWHAVMIPCRDLTMREVLDEYYGNETVPPSSTLILANAGVSIALQSYAPASILFSTMERVIHPAPNHSPAADTERVARTLAGLSPTAPHRCVIPSPKQLITVRSQAASLSGHWLPNEVALAYTYRP